MTQEILEQHRFKQFTERAKRTVAVTQEHAALRNSSRIEINDLIYALSESGGVAEKVLESIVGDLGPFRHGLSLGDEDSGQTGVRLSDQMEEAIKRSVEEAKKLNHGYIGTEHLLLGALSVAVEKPTPVLETFGVTYEKAKLEVEKILDERVSSQTERGRLAKQPLDITRYLSRLNAQGWRIYVQGAPGLITPSEVDEIRGNFVVVTRDGEKIIIPTNLATFRITPPESESS